MQALSHTSSLLRPAPITNQRTTPRIVRVRIASNDISPSSGASVLDQDPNDLAGREPDAASDASQCPVLRSLSPVPKSAATWRDWPMQFSNFRGFHSASLAGRPLAWSSFFMVPMVVPGNADVAREILFKEHSGDIIAGWPDTFLQLQGRHSLSHVWGDEHRRVRALMQPAFSPEAIARFIPTIQGIAERQAAEWADETAAGGPVKGRKGMALHAFEVILQVTLGRPRPKEEWYAMHDLFETWSKGLFTLAPYDLPFLAFGKAMEARRKLVAQLGEAVALERAELAAGRPGKGIIAALVAVKEDGHKLTDEQIIDNALLLLYAGYDTTASSLSSIMFNLSSHPEAMRKLRAEQAQVRAAHGDALSARALRDMVYTEAVIRESMRLRPAAGGVFRKVARETDVAGHAVPTGTQINVPISYLSMKDPRWADCADVDAFKPERMLVEEGREKGWQMPFGAGNRTCIGAVLSMTEMKVLLAVLARDYTMTADTDTTWGTIPMPFPKNGLPMWFSRLAQ